MADGKDMEGRAAHSVLLPGHASTPFVTAPAEHEFTIIKESPAVAVPARPVATFNAPLATNWIRRPNFPLSPKVLSPGTYEGQRKPADFKWVTGVKASPLSPKLHKSALNVVRPYQQQQVQQPAGHHLAAGGGQFSPSMEIVAGGIRALGGYQENDTGDTAATCVLTYMCIVIVVIAALLIYIFRSLVSQPPEVTSLFPEFEETTAQLPPRDSTMNEEDELVLAGAMPLSERKRKSVVPRPRAGDQQDVSAGATIKASTEEARVDARKAAATTSATTPDEEQRVVEFIVFGPTREERLSTSNYRDVDLGKKI